MEQAEQNQPQVWPTDSAERFAAAVQRAAQLLRAGQVVALPTETVYGLAANALDPAAVERIFQLKGRPFPNPVIVHVADLAMARQCVAQWPPSADHLAESFWPGPLTLVLPRSAAIPAIVTAGGPTVGIRWPSHPFMQAVIRTCGFPLAAPSANLSNRLSPTNAEHVRQQLGTQIPLIVDGGQAQVGIESTVLDLTTVPPRVLRPGIIHEPGLIAVIGPVELGPGPACGALKSPGLLRKHYAPKARLLIRAWHDEMDLIKLQAREGISGRAHVIAHTHIPSGRGFERISVIPHDPIAFARAIYAELHECDRCGAEWIIVEAPPETAEWRAIADRLNRAAA